MGTSLGARAVPMLSPVFWKSLARWLALLGVLILWHPSTQAIVVQAGLITAAVGLFASAFYWPRCPHCGARVVRFNAREWIPRRVCWQCGQAYIQRPRPTAQPERGA